MSNLHQSWLYVDDYEYIHGEFKELFLKEYPQFSKYRLSTAFLIHKVIQELKGEL